MSKPIDKEIIEQTKKFQEVRAKVEKIIGKVFDIMNDLNEQLIEPTIDSVIEIASLFATIMDVISPLFDNSFKEVNKIVVSLIKLLSLFARIINEILFLITK